MRLMRRPHCVTWRWKSAIALADQGAEVLKCLGDGRSNAESLRGVMNSPLIRLMRAIASGDGPTSEQLFLDELKANVYTGDTALHVATSRPRHRCHREGAAR